MEKNSRTLSCPDMNFVILADDEFGKFNLNLESIPVVRKFK